LQEHHDRSGADAADADHLACHVDDGESVQQLSAVVAEGGLVDAELLLDCVPGLLGCHLVAGSQVSQGDDDGRSADDAMTTVDNFGELGQRAEAVAGVGFAKRLVPSLVRFGGRRASSTGPGQRGR
jgi:hypothetical protein